MNHTAKAAPSADDTSRLTSRYELGPELGRGGMAVVHRATERSTRRQVALKQLLVEGTAAASSAALFEREFHTLVQLRHPHVVEVYDYGLGDDGVPFYTMELLDGGDLRERAPLAWREVCRVSFEVCSALALLHSRRLVHRDVGPRNIRCTARGDAKLIDFGALAPMTDGGAVVVGTPSFTAPETLERLALDARTDLYSLGATAYYALTGRVPYPARTFPELLSAWRVKPVAPSAIVADIPAALDDLLLALVSVDPALRPQTAFEVMQRLAVCADLRARESEAVARAYLATPTLVGRTSVLESVRASLDRAQRERVPPVMFQGPPGIGRSRLLDACSLEARTRGFTVLRATASGAREAFSVAHALTTHLLDALPVAHSVRDFPEIFLNQATPANDHTEGEPHGHSLRSFTDPAVPRAQLQRALRRLWTSVSRTHPLLVAIDDVHKMDEPSAALVAELLDKSKRGGLWVALTAETGEAVNTAQRALSWRCNVQELTLLTFEQTTTLLASVFGDVANLGLLADEVQRVALGNPRQTLDLAQHLVERGLIRYSSAIWTLPHALSAADMPRSAAAAMHAQVARLSAHARYLAEAQALAFYGTFTDDNYRELLPEASALEVDTAVSELLAARALVRDGALYMLANRVWIAALRAELDDDQEKHLHEALTTMYLLRVMETGVAAVHHAFACGRDEQGLEVLDIRNTILRTEADYMQLVELNVAKMMWCYPRAIAVARKLGRGARELHDLRRWQFLGAVIDDETLDRESAQTWFEQLARDSGLTAYRRDTESSNAGERLMRALQAAQQSYLATPEAERVYPVDEAIRKLGEYVVVWIAISGRTLDTSILRGLPEILEPFVPLSPLLDAIWNNARATRLSQCFLQHEQALACWRETLTKLDALDDSVETFIVAMRNAIAYAIGQTEAQLGIASAEQWAERLDKDPYQRVGALDLRRVVRLAQGDAAAADRLRREAEVLALQQRVPPMFKLLLTVELSAYANSGDLAGVAQVIEQIKPWASHFPAWQVHLRSAEAAFELVRGDYEAAREKFEDCIAATCSADGEPSALGAWIVAQTGLVDSLFGLHRYEEARTVASTALRVCASLQLGAAAFELTRALALVEAKLGDPESARRMERLIACQNELGATGLRMGLSYEARARIAIWAGDAEAFETFARLAAREYRHGARTALAARYERLINEAARSGLTTRVGLNELQAWATHDVSAVDDEERVTMVTRSLASARSTDERMDLALHAVCSAFGANLGHLYWVTPTAASLRASRGAEPASSELAEHVARYVADKQQSAEELDELVTGELSAEAMANPVVRVAHTSYELLPLQCVVDSQNACVGVVAIAHSEHRPRNQKQARLLHAVATSLHPEASRASTLRE
jgi:serine/threonine protein kinase/tetratricopeptide (TPR) repeat protein